MLPVLIIGAGPVGMTAALDLAKRGVKSEIVEMRAENTPADAKCNTVASRTMEVFRSLGIADAVRAVGLGDDYPTDVLFTTQLIDGKEITRINLPSRNERFSHNGRSAKGYADSDWQTAEPVVRVSQYYLEPVMQKYVQANEMVDIHYSTQLESFEDKGNHVAAKVKKLKTGEVKTIKARYMIGCDGGRSTVRKQLNIALQGDAIIGRQRSTLIRTKDLKSRLKGRHPWMSWVVNHHVTGVVVAIDGDELWLVHRNIRPDAPDFDSLDKEQSLRTVLGVGDDFTYEEIKHEDWTARRLVAERFRIGNVFICGDAAHLWVPFAGYGMNAGIADATNLTWMLAGVINGWADAAILDAHNRERHPITEQVSQFAMQLASEYVEKVSRRRVPKILSAGGFIGNIIRKFIGRGIYDMNLPQFACAGLNYGYYYDDSPLIAYDGEQAPVYTMGDYTASTVPGCRMPHFWLDDESSLYDKLTDGFTLLCFDAAIKTEVLQKAADKARLPFAVLNCEAPPRSDWLTTKLILVRPDRHVAWRGDRPPTNAQSLIDLIRGANRSK